MVDLMSALRDQSRNVSSMVFEVAGLVGNQFAEAGNEADYGDDGGSSKIIATHS